MRCSRSATSAPTDRKAFKMYALAATMVKNQSHWRAFETVFEMYFSPRRRVLDLNNQGRRRQPGRRSTARTRATGTRPRARARRRRGAAAEPDDARGAGPDAVPGADDRRAAGWWPVRRYGRFAGMGQAVRSAARTTCTARCGTSTSTGCWRLMEQARQEARRRADPLEQRLRRRVRAPHRAAQSKEIEAEIRRRLVADARRGHGQDAAQAAARGRRLHARLPRGDGGAAQGAHPLTRRLAVRLARKRRTAAGRSTSATRCATHCQLRRRSRRAEVPPIRGRKPEIFVVADISGSVAAFARFTLHLVYAIASQFSGAQRSCSSTASTRSPVLRGRRTSSRRSTGSTPRPTRGLGRRPLGLRPRLRGVLGTAGAGGRPQDDGDHPGRCPQQLPRVAGPGSSGDAPEGPSRLLAEPPSPAYWDTGDSIVGEYAVHCDGASECRNLRQLEAVRRPPV